MMSCSLLDRHPCQNSHNPKQGATQVPILWKFTQCKHQFGQYEYAIFDSSDNSDMEGRCEYAVISSCGQPAKDTYLVKVYAMYTSIWTIWVCHFWFNGEHPIVFVQSYKNKSFTTHWMQLCTTVVNDLFLNMPGVDTSLYITVCCKSLISQMLLEGFSNMEINGHENTTIGQSKTSKL